MRRQRPLSTCASPEAVVLQLEDKAGVIERLGEDSERHRREGKRRAHAWVRALIEKSVEFVLKSLFAHGGAFRPQMKQIPPPVPALAGAFVTLARELSSLHSRATSTGIG
jgi:hypothetical protein